MAVLSGQVSVTNAATPIVAAVNTSWRSEGAPSETPHRCVVLFNGSGAVIFLGPSTVTALTGLQVPVSTSVTIWLAPDEAIYGITASSSSTVSYVESGN